MHCIFFLVLFFHPFDCSVKLPTPMKINCHNQKLFTQVYYPLWTVATLLSLPCRPTFIKRDTASEMSWWSIILILSGDISLNLDSSVRNIKSCLLNAWSLQNITSVFSDFVLSNDLDIIGLTETWLRPSDTQGLVDVVTPAGFMLHVGTRKEVELLFLSGTTLIASFVKLIT